MKNQIALFLHFFFKLSECGLWVCLFLSDSEESPASSPSSRLFPTGPGGAALVRRGLEGRQRHTDPSIGLDVWEEAAESLEKVRHWVGEWERQASPLKAEENHRSPEPRRWT